MIRFNEHGPDGLVNMASPGAPPKLEAKHKASLSRVTVEEGPIPAIHGVVRWRCDLIMRLHEEFGISVSDDTICRTLKGLGFSHVSARPKAYRQDPGAVEAFKKSLPIRVAEIRAGLAPGILVKIPGRDAGRPEEQAHLPLRCGGKSRGAGWYSFDAGGVHFVWLVNVVDLKAGGLGNLGGEQLEWLEDDLRDRPASVMQKVEGNVAFHTAMSTAFPQPAPGTAPSPGPMKVAPDKLRSLLGITHVKLVPGQQRLAVVDRPGAWLEGARCGGALSHRCRRLGPGRFSTTISKIVPLTPSVAYGVLIW